MAGTDRPGTATAGGVKQPPQAGQRRLGSNVLANVLNVLASVGTSLIATPIILSSLGLEALGVWTIAQAIIVYVVTTDAGVGPAVVRFIAVHRGAGRDADVRRVMWTSLFGYLVLGVVIVVGIQLLNRALLGLFDVPAALRKESSELFRLTAVVVVLALLSVTLANVLQGLERFGEVAVTAACASATFLIVLVAMLRSGAGLPGIGVAAASQQLVGGATRAFCLRRLLTGRPVLMSKTQALEFGRFAARLQMNVASALIVTQSDRVVVGVVATPAATGQVGIAAQLADGGRALCGAALGPFTSRMSRRYGEGDVEGVAQLHRRLGELWLALVLGGTVIAGLSLPPLIQGWLGSDVGETATYARLLVGGTGLLLATGVTTSYLRAIGRPGYEVGYGLITIVVNVVLSVALGATFGAIGVVAATPAAYFIAGAWLVIRVEPAASGTRAMVVKAVMRGLPSAVVLGSVALVANEVTVAALPRGVSLLPAGVILGSALLLHVSAVVHAKPTPSALRRRVREVGSAP